MPKAIVTIEREVLLDAWRNGDWHFVGVRAKAVIKIPYGADFIETTVSSPGLWGVESDCGEEYLNHIFGEERTILLGMLEALHDFEVA